MTMRSEGLASVARMADPVARAGSPALDIVFDVIDPSSVDARSAIDRYFAELDVRFRTGFDPGPGGAAADADTMRAPAGAFVLARSDGGTVGCGGVIRVDDHTAEIKRMWVHPERRGQGVGRRLLAHLEGVAAALGHRRVVLDTNESLAEAIAMYGRSGYRPIDRYNDNPYAHHWFAKDLEVSP
jgi:GNAT superfamily N-acetyltransferase